MPETLGAPPKVACPARVGLADGRTFDTVFYLLMDELRPGGLMPLEEILEGSRSFIPVGLSDGKTALLARDAICTVEIGIDQVDSTTLPPTGGSVDVVTLHLVTGRQVSGVLRTLEPPESIRMSDAFNNRGRFVPLGVGDRVLLVSKAHITQAVF